MKTQLLVLSFVFSGLVSCHSQEVQSGKQLKGKDKPQEEIQVNRKYDDKGNLIEFDSTYSLYYSTFMGDTLNADSILHNFHMYFNHSLPGISSNDFFGMDSTFLPGFFHDDFFEQQFFYQEEMMLQIMREMDSIKNEFFKMHSKQMEEYNL